MFETIFIIVLESGILGSFDECLISKSGSKILLEQFYPNFEIYVMNLTTWQTEWPRGCGAEIKLTPIRSTWYKLSNIQFG